MGPYPLINNFDGIAFASRYGLQPGDFWCMAGQLFLRDGLTLPDDPPIQTACQPIVLLLRSQAVSLATDPGAASKLVRAVDIADINQTVQQLNVLRANLTSLITAITAQGATLPSIVAAAKQIPPMPQIDVNAAIAAVKSDWVNQINSGAAD